MKALHTDVVLLCNHKFGSKHIHCYSVFPPYCWLIFCYYFFTLDSRKEQKDLSFAGSLPITHSQARGGPQGGGKTTTMHWEQALTSTSGEGVVLSLASNVPAIHVEAGNPVSGENLVHGGEEVNSTLVGNTCQRLEKGGNSVGVDNHLIDGFVEIVVNEDIGEENFEMSEDNEGDESNDSLVRNIEFDDSADENNDNEWFNCYMDQDAMGNNETEMHVAANVAGLQMHDAVFRAEVLDGMNIGGPSSAPNMQPVGVLDSDYESESLNSVELNCDDDVEQGEGSKYPKFNPAEMRKEYAWEKGLEFTSTKQFKDAMREWCLLNGRDVKFRPNDTKRCRAKCKAKNCDFVCLVSKVGGAETYSIKTLYPRHTCVRTVKGKLATTNWVADKIAEHTRNNQKMKLSNVIDTVKSKYMCEISVNKAYWARRKAEEKLNGRYDEQYEKLWDYGNELMRSNPSSTLKLLLERPSFMVLPRFQRFYMCLEPVKRGFLAACRPIIGLDGCHLKGLYRGQLLVAVARDPNDEYFSLAVAAVEAEVKDSWCWFLELLMQDIGASTRAPVFISDQQKGLVPAFAETVPQAELRYCVRHIYANIKRRHGGGAVIRNLVLAASKATYYNEWERHMLQLKKIKAEAYNHLMGIDPKLWARSFFSFNAKSDMVMNNISEAFNGRIIEARDKPIITMMEWIRVYWMTRFADNRAKYAAYKGKINPKPRKRLDKEVSECGKWGVKWAGAQKFEVAMYPDKFVVDLLVGSCSCNFWGLTGIPCRHACACIFHLGDEPEKYVSRYLFVETYRDCYAPIVNPVNGENLWTHVNKIKILPPKHRVPPGRPRKLRIREPDEPEHAYKLRRVNTSLRCSKCKQYGHNQRTCKNPTPIQSSNVDSASTRHSADATQFAQQTIRPSIKHGRSSTQPIRSSATAYTKAARSFAVAQTQPVDPVAAQAVTPSIGNSNQGHIKEVLKRKHIPRKKVVSGTYTLGTQELRHSSHPPANSKA